MPNRSDAGGIRANRAKVEEALEGSENEVVSLPETGKSRGMKILRQADYKVMPWKNGGGVTTEIAVFPTDSGLRGDPFQWRVSVADVTEDGPFSSFRGYDRHIMLLEGNGMRLEIEGEAAIDLTAPFRPAAFSGDWAVSGKLHKGPVRDFNLMVARQFGRGSLVCQKLSAPLPLTGYGPTRLVYCIDGEASIGGHIVGRGETVILTATEGGVLTPLAEDIIFALCAIDHHGQDFLM